MTDERGASMAPQEQVRRNLDAFEADLLAVIQHHAAMIGVRTASHGLIELTGSVCATVIEAAPEARPELVTKLEELRLFVATAAQAPQ